MVRTIRRRACRCLSLATDHPEYSYFLISKCIDTETTFCWQPDLGLFGKKISGKMTATRKSTREKCQFCYSWMRQLSASSSQSVFTMAKMPHFPATLTYIHFHFCCVKNKSFCTLCRSIMTRFYTLAHIIGERVIRGLFIIQMIGEVH